MSVPRRLRRARLAVTTLEARDVPTVLDLTPVGTHATGVFDRIAAESVAYDPVTRQAFVTNSATDTIDVLDLRNPASPALLRTLDVSAYGDPTSVVVHHRVVAVAVVPTNYTLPGTVVFFHAATGEQLNALTVGANPDMLAVSPNGHWLLVADEGQPSDDYVVDPEGTVSIIDMGGPGFVRRLDNADVRTAGFGAFNASKDALTAAGVRIYGPNATVAQDLEPEYITISADSKTAWVTLQENNALAVIDIRDGVVTDILPLGYKDHSQPQGFLQTFEFGQMPSIGRTMGNQLLRLGGFSGLAFEGYAPNGDLKFITHTDRGPNGEPLVAPQGNGERPFLLPDFTPEIVRFRLSKASGKLIVTDRIPLRLADGTRLTGLPNTAIAGGNANTPFNDEVPVDLAFDPLPRDPLGADLEGIVVDPTDGTFWMVDEYRPAIYHFAKNGRMIDRFIPVGTAAAAGEPAGTFGSEVLPAELAQRRQNRGFEGVALQDGKVFAFVQSPIRNPITLGNSALNAMRNVRVLEFDPATHATRQFLYVMDNPNLGTPDNTRPDKIGDAVAIGNGEFLVVERDDDAIDSDPASNIEKKIYRISLAGATDVTGKAGLFDVGGGMMKSIDQMTAAELALPAVGVTPIAKTLHLDLNAAGYNMVEKVEGLTLVDANTIAVLNDNDFGVAGITLNGDGTFVPNPNPESIVLGLIRVAGTGIDASDRDSKINIANWPVRGMYQPDAIASYKVGGQTFLVTANEGDARGYTAFNEEVRVGSLDLDNAAFPNESMLKNNANLGRLNVTRATGDTDGDGDFDQLFVFGGRSLSIWSADGKLVFDSGDELERITAAAAPAFFNASGTDNAFDSRFDNKGPEPEGVVLGKVKGRTYAFIGLERIGGVVVYDVTDPHAPAFVKYVNNRDFTQPVSSAAALDLGPEVLTFVPAANSPNGKPLLLVANEVSGTTTVYEIDVAGPDGGDEGENEQVGESRSREFTLVSIPPLSGGEVKGPGVLGSRPTNALRKPFPPRRTAPVSVGPAALPSVKPTTTSDIILGVDDL